MNKLKQADDIARQLKTTRKGRKFLRKLKKFHELWLEDLAAAAALEKDAGAPVQRVSPDLLKSLAADIDSNFKSL